MTLNCLTTPNWEFYTEEEIVILRKNPIPKHVAIIMDGNRRWVKTSIASLANPLHGHWAGAKAVLDIVRAAQELGIKTLTVYGFSTENWSRTPNEIETLVSIFQTYLKENRLRMVKQGVRFNVIGDITPFSPVLQKEIELTLEATKENKEIDFVVALNYGGRDEICRSIKKVFRDLEEKKIAIEEITEELFGRYLDTSRWGDPELLIRTSGEKRISNFLLWQAAYSELYITDTLWPDFTPKELFKAVREFQNRQRRMGR